MDINIFNDPSKVPQPRDEIRIESLQATPYSDRYRVHVEVTVTMFQERPNLLLVARNSEEKIVAELNIIATMHAEMEFTLHLRNVVDPAGTYTLHAELFYETRNPPQDNKTIEFVVPDDES